LRRAIRAIEKLLGEKSPGAGAAAADRPAASSENEAMVPRPRKARRERTVAEGWDGSMTVG
jgi:hypothetical protein